MPKVIRQTAAKKTSQPLSISNSTGEAARHGVTIGKLGTPSLICNLGRDTTALNHLKIKSDSGRSGSDVKPIPLGTDRPDSAHIVHEVLLRNINRNMQRVKALIECRATSIFKSPSLLRKLGLAH
jgi:hypothetical protein